MHHPHYYGAYYNRGPRRFWWFILGGATVALWHHWSEKKERGGLFCRREWRRVTDRNEPAPVNNASNDTGYSYSSEESKPLRETQERKLTSEPLWKLRSEKEQERKQHEKEVEYREDMLRAREAVLSATENGLQSLQKSLDSLTKLIHEQRRDRASREASPEPKVEKKD